MTFDLNAVKAEIEKIYDEVVALRREIHMHPEVGEQEAETEKRICNWLDALEIPYENHIAGHGVCATIYGQKTDRTVAIRADIDALPVQEATGLPYASKTPGVMHACGHDMHTAILLGTAKILKEHAADLPGTVKLFFQPAEETIGGADRMIQAGCMENPPVRDVIALHVAPMIDSGKLEVIRGYMNASTCEVNITVKGKSCHGAHPEGGLDALPPACAILLGVQTIITRNLPPTTPAIITFGKFHSGTAKNVISGEAIMQGTIRAFDLELREFIKGRIETLAKDTAAAYGADCEVTFENGYPPLVNDGELYDMLTPVLEETFGSENIVVAEVPSMGGDDFAYFTQNGCRGFYFNLGTHNPADPQHWPLHNEHMAPDEEAIKNGILAEILSVHTVLTSQK